MQVANSIRPPRLGHLFTLASTLSLMVSLCPEPPVRAGLPARDSIAPRVITRLKGRGGSLVRFSPDGSLLITVGDKDLQVWDAKTFMPVGSPIAFPDEFVRAGFIDRGHIAFVAHSKGLWLWDPRTGKRIGPGVRAPLPVYVAAVSPDGTRAAINWTVPTAAYSDRRIRLFDTGSGKEIGQLPHASEAVFATFSPDGRRLLTMEWVGRSARFHLWDLSVRKDVIPPIETGCDANCPPGSEIVPGLFSPDGDRFAVATGDLFAVFDAKAGRLLAGNVPPHDSSFYKTVMGLHFSADGKSVLCARDDVARGGEALLCDAGSVRVKVQVRIPGTLLEHSACADATRLACLYSVGLKDGESVNAMGIWDLEAGKLLHLLPGRNEQGVSAFNPSGDQLAVTGTGVSNADTTIWEITSTAQ